jgi:hypothetical protein
MLTVLEEKLAEAHALAIAADAVTAKVLERIADVELRHDLHALQRDAAETRARCLALEERYDEETRRELLHHVGSTRDKATDLAGAWFKAGTGPIASWTFLAMGEAAEVAAWSAVTALAVRARDGAVCDLAGWALGLQQRHLRVALEGAVRLAERTDPDAPRWG